MEKTFEKYFLAANSCEGFCEHFTDSYSLKDGWRAFIIKGGPGTGKSSMMKYIAAKASDKGMKVTLCVCSSDPDSLDGVIIEDVKAVVLDGTAPHIVEPESPGICEEILNLGQFWDSDILRYNKDIILSIMAENKAHHSTASRYLYACGQMLRDNYKISSSLADKEKITKFTQNLCKKNIPATKKTGSEVIRFASGVTPKGVVSYINNLSKFYTKKIIIEDKHGGVSSLMMEAIREYALNCGHSIITLRNPFLPSLMIDHIIIPELSLMFATENAFCHIEGEERRIHARRFIDIAVRKKHRGRFAFNSEVAKQLIFCACKELSKAKLQHDRLERYYIKAMDFEGLTNFAKGWTEKILSE